jgi:uncharacterized protein YbaP (TraB family)
MKNLNLKLSIIGFVFFTFFNLNAKTFMWKVESEKNIVYILGSIHYADSTLYPLDNQIENAFNSSKYLVLEIDLSNVNPLDMLKYANLPDTLTLAGAVDSAAYSKFSYSFEKHNIPKMIYNKLKPWFAVMTLQSLELISSGFAADYGLDMHFMQKAETEKKQIKELETIDFQMKLLEQLNDYTGAYLEETLREMDMTGQQIDSLLIAWKAGDTSAVAKYMNQGSDLKDFDKVMQKINYDRNINMVKKIEDYLTDDKKHFVVVGAAHLIGEKGIISLLEKTGKYKIKQI